MEYLQKTDREMDTVTSVEQVDHVITKYLLEQELIFKIDPFDKKAVIKRILEEGEKILIQLSNAEDIPAENSFTLYMILAKYIQLECIFLQKLENSLFTAKVGGLAIARKNRENQRFPVEPGFMYVTNVISSKNVIEANMFNIPTLVKVNFEDYKNRLKQKRKILSISIRSGLVWIANLKSLKRRSNTFSLKTPKIRTRIRATRREELTMKRKWTTIYPPVLKITRIKKLFPNSSSRSFT